MSSAASAESAWSADQRAAAEVLREMVTNLPVADHRIVTNDGPAITPGPGNPATGANFANSAQVLDTAGINGVGQQIAFIANAAQTGAGLSLCTGSLINPRTVLTAAHCVYARPAHVYGADTGTGMGINPGTPLANAYGTTTGVPISFGFAPTNRCLGVAANGCAVGQGAYESWRDSGFATNAAKYIYNGNQVWYHPAATTEFGLGDIAIVTLDTHVKNVPTWTLLFSPITESTHVAITGYGAAGVGTPGIGDWAGIDYRRRVAENMLDGLMSSHDWISSPAQGSFFGFDFYQHSLYWFDFDDPAYDPENPVPAANSGFLPENSALPAVGLNWNQNGLGGGALPLEGTTAGGDSGGPLIVDTKFGKPVVIGVLTGGWSYDSIGTYGEYSVYPPLFLYWADIVTNNPYKYVSAKEGDGNWMDPTHWVQDMDPNYAVLNGAGELVTGLPDVAQLDQDSSAARWGTNCFFETLCTDVAGTAYPIGDGKYIVVQGGPGSTNFVPNNVEPVNSATPGATVKAKYYDVTLNKAGKTTLSAAVTIDKLTVDGSAKLQVATTGSLNVLGDYNQFAGWTNVDGNLKTSEALLAAGILSGKGTFDPTVLTVVAGAVAPGGGDKIGNFTVKGDVIMSSGASLFIDAQRGGADKLIVAGDGAGDTNSLTLSTGTGGARPSVVFNKVTDGPAPRHNESYVIAQADGGITGTFGKVYTFQGVLRPELTYTANAVTATLRAGSLVEILDGGNATEIAFASALDTLRSGYYDRLFNLYGNVDWMNAGQLSATFASLSPVNMVQETRSMQDRQSARFLGNVGDRLSLMGTGRASGISFSGGASALAQSREGMSASAQLGLTDGNSVTLASTGGLSGFVAMGGDTIGSTYGDNDQASAGQHSRYFASGIEAPFGDAMIGTAVGYAETRSMIGQDESSTKMTQAAAYASLPVGKSAYVGGVVAAERSVSDANRMTTDTTSMFRLSGATSSARYMANLEAGVRKAIGSGLYLNPRAQLGFSHYALGGFRETGGETALALDTLKVNRIESRFGAKLDGATSLGKWSFRPSLQADYVRLLSGADAGLKVAFAAAPDMTFALPLTGGGSGWVEMKGGVEMTRGKFSLGLTGQATAGDAPLADQRGAVEMKLRF